MNQARRHAAAAGAAVLLLLAFVGVLVQCSQAQAFDVTYYYLPG